MYKRVPKNPEIDASSLIVIIHNIYMQRIRIFLWSHVVYWISGWLEAAKFELAFLGGTWILLYATQTDSLQRTTQPTVIWAMWESKQPKPEAGQSRLFRSEVVIICLVSEFPHTHTSHTHHTHTPHTHTHTTHTHTPHTHTHTHKTGLI